MGAPLPAKVTRIYKLSAIFFAAIVGVNIYMFTQAFNGKSRPSANAPVLTQALPSNLLSLQKVKGLVEAEVPNVPITKIELHSEGDTFIYTVSLADNTSLRLNAQTGAKVSPPTARKDVAEEKLPAGTPTIDFVRAREIALTQKPNSVVSTIELGAESGKTIYRVRFADGGSIIIAAGNGAIVRTEEAPKSTSSSDAVGNTGTSPSGNTTVEKTPEPTDSSTGSQTSEPPTTDPPTPEPSGSTTP